MSHEYSNPAGCWSDALPAPTPVPREFWPDAIPAPAPAMPSIPVPQSKLEFYTLLDLFADISKLVGSNQPQNVEVRVGGNAGAPALCLVRHFDDAGQKSTIVLRVE